MTKNKQKRQVTLLIGIFSLIMGIIIDFSFSYLTIYNILILIKELFIIDGNMYFEEFSIYIARLISIPFGIKIYKDMIPIISTSIGIIKQSLSPIELNAGYKKDNKEKKWHACTVNTDINKAVININVKTEEDIDLLLNNLRTILLERIAENNSNNSVSIIEKLQPKTKQKFDSCSSLKELDVPRFIEKEEYIRHSQSYIDKKYATSCNDMSHFYSTIQSVYSVNSDPIYNANIKEHSELSGDSSSNGYISLDIDDLESDIDYYIIRKTKNRHDPLGSFEYDK